MSILCQVCTVGEYGIWVTSYMLTLFPLGFGSGGRTRDGSASAATEPRATHVIGASGGRHKGFVGLPHS